MDNFRLAVFGCSDQALHPEIRKIATSIDFVDYDAEKLLDPLQDIPTAIICYPPNETMGMGSLEIAQALRTVYPKVPMYYVALSKSDFDKKKLIKNGFNSVFLMPWEKADFIRSVRSDARYTKMPELKDYRPVKVMDLRAGIVLEFDLKIYLPQNNKLLMFSISGNPVDDVKLQKLHASDFNTLYVHQDDIAKFHEYTKNVLVNLNNGAPGETEKQEKLERSVRELMSDMFIDDNFENTFGKSAALLVEVREIIKLMIQDHHADVLSKISGLINQENSFYVHLTNVSTYAGLFAMLAGEEHPDEIALAGLLHDLGKILLPVEFAELEEQELSTVALAAFEQHPRHTVDLLKRKKIVIPESTERAILQHHERLDGSGYPNKLNGQRISRGARILSIADCFDELTSLHPGRQKLSPKEAIAKMIEENSRDPGKRQLDIEILRRLSNCLFEVKDGN